MVERYRHHERKVDRISLLPDELLVSILSLLSFKQAAATSILCRRWRYLHTWTRKLDFDGAEAILKLISYVRSPLRGDERCRQNLGERRIDYIKWIDGVISLNQSSALEEFRVFFNLDRSNSAAIDRWLRFALSRRIETLELNLTNEGERRRRKYDEVYIFPYISEVEKFKFVKKLSTNLVNVCGEFVKELVRNCSLLQQLSVTESQNLVFVEVIKPSPSFNCLEINLCGNLESLVICDSNVVNLKVQTSSMHRIEHVVLENVPLLSELWCWLGQTMDDIRYMFSSVLPQLRLFKLFTYLSDGGLEEAEERNICSDFEMSNLKQLVLAVDDFDRILPTLVHLINASPKLERLVVEAPECDEEEEEENVVWENYKRRKPPPANRKMERAQSAGISIPKNYPCLKELEIEGYSDLEALFEVVMYLVENGIALESIVVDPRRVYFHLDNWWEFVRQRKVSDDALKMALELNDYVPPRINLEILL